MVDRQVTGAIIQARMGSTRLRGKVIQPLPFGDGPTLIEHIVNRANQASSLDKVVVAITDDPVDDPFFEFLSENGIPVFRGDAENVLKRYVDCAREWQIDQIVRLTGDNPVIDPQLLDECMQFHLEGNWDYMRSEGLPLGTNFEIMQLATLEEVQQKAQLPAEKEHVTAYMLTHPEEFKLGRKKYQLDQALSHLRLTVDYPTDLAMMNLLFNRLGANIGFGLEEIGQLLTSEPWLAEVNPNYHKQIFKNEQEELEEAIRQLQTMDMPQAARIIEQYLGNLK